MMEQVRRMPYLDLMHEFKNKTSVIKVITGMRRCGKSTLLKQFKNELTNEGIDDEHIFHMDFDSFEGQEIIATNEFISKLKSLPKDKNVYILLDEIQQVPEWEKVLAALKTISTNDIYITGSNSYMLSTDLATHLSGRYIEINMLPLSFKEYLLLYHENVQFIVY